MAINKSFSAPQGCSSLPPIHTLNLPTMPTRRTYVPPANQLRSSGLASAHGFESASAPVLKHPTPYRPRQLSVSSCSSASCSPSPPPVCSISRYSQRMQALARVQTAELRKRLYAGDTVRLTPCSIEQADAVLISPQPSSQSSSPLSHSPPLSSSKHGKRVSLFLTGLTLEHFRRNKDKISVKNAKVLSYRVVNVSADAPNAPKSERSPSPTFAIKQEDDDMEL